MPGIKCSFLSNCFHETNLFMMKNPLAKAVRNLFFKAKFHFQFCITFQFSMACNNLTFQRNHYNLISRIFGSTMEVITEFHVN